MADPKKPSSAERDRLRAVALKSTRVHSLVDWSDPNSPGDPPVQFEVRPATAAQQEYAEERLVWGKGKNARLNNVRASLYFVLHNTFVPGTEERVFEEADREALLNQPVQKGSLLGKLQEAMVTLMGISAEDVEKN